MEQSDNVAIFRFSWEPILLTHMEKPTWLQSLFMFACWFVFSPTAFAQSPNLHVVVPHSEAPVSLDAAFLPYFSLTASRRAIQDRVPELLVDQLLGLKFAEEQFARLHSSGITADDLVVDAQRLLLIWGANKETERLQSQIALMESPRREKWIEILRLDKKRIKTSPKGKYETFLELVLDRAAGSDSPARSFVLDLVVDKGSKPEIGETRKRVHFIRESSRFHETRGRTVVFKSAPGWYVVSHNLATKKSSNVRLYKKVVIGQFPNTESLGRVSKMFLDDKSSQDQVESELAEYKSKLDWYKSVSNGRPVIGNQFHLRFKRATSFFPSHSAFEARLEVEEVFLGDEDHYERRRHFWTQELAGSSRSKASASRNVVSITNKTGDVVFFKAAQSGYAKDYKNSSLKPGEGRYFSQRSTLVVKFDNGRNEILIKEYRLKGRKFDSRERPQMSDGRKYSFQKSGRSYNLYTEPPDKQEAGVLVLVHGVNQDKEAYAKFKKKIACKHLKHIPICEFSWGEEPILSASDSIGGRAQSAFGMSDQAFVAVAKLKDVVARIRNNIGEEAPIRVLSYSQGTLVTLCALQEGMSVDHWILMGSPLDKEIVSERKGSTRFDLASKNVSGSIINLHSRSDMVAGYKGGIGSFGMPRSIRGLGALKNGRLGNIRNQYMQGVSHTEPKSWWTMEWLELNDRRPWGGPVGKKELLDILGAGIKSGSSQPSSSLKGIFDFAAAGTRRTSWRKIFGDANRDSFSHTFLLTPGMMNGIYFDDKDEASYTVECLEGSCEFGVKSATFSSWNQRSKTRVLNAGQRASGNYEVANRIYDATIFLHVKARGHNNAKVRVSFSAKDR